MVSRASFRESGPGTPATNELISVVAACFNEEANVRRLYGRVRDALEDGAYEFELIFVDDGSRDGTFAELCRLSKEDPRVRVVRLVRNFGHQAALSAGLRAARGAAIVTLDADLQHPPEVIPELIRIWRQGVEIVYALRGDSPESTHLKRVTSRLFYWLMRHISDVDLPSGAADFRLMSRRVVDVLNELPERSRLLRGLVHWTGYSFATVYYQEDRRYAGVSKYSLRKMAGLCVDSITAFSTLPLRLSTIVGVVSATAAALYAVGAITLRLFAPGIAVEGWASVLVSLLFLGGVQLLALGLIGEYIGRIFEEAKGRPLYLVRDRLGFDDPNSDGQKQTIRRTMAVAPVSTQRRRRARRAVLQSMSVRGN